MAERIEWEEKVTIAVMYGVLLTVATLGNTLVTYFIMGIYYMETFVKHIEPWTSHLINIFFPLSTTSTGQGLQLLHVESDTGRLLNALLRMRLQTDLSYWWVTVQFAFGTRMKLIY